ncbi:MAG TPA: hypothetical protein VF556_09140 [Pyrinomonadaceae bacterium]|jgi:hypothetical protein
MENNTTIQEERTKLLEKLNDWDFSRKVYTQKLHEAEELIAQILMVTSGVMEVAKTGEEFGHENIYKILDMFVLRHDNFSRATLAEELQR